jgi:uncharacterized protein
MPTVTETLKDCHRLRKHIRELQNEIDRGPRVLQEKKDWLTSEESLHKIANDTIRQLKLKQKEDEGSLKQVEAHLSKLGDRAMTVTTMKEMDATRNETEIAQSNKGELEDLVLATIMDIESRTAQLPKDSQRWAEAQSEFKLFEADAKERYDRIVEELDVSKLKLAERDAELPSEMKPIYDRLVKTYGADGIAGVKGRICQQCRQSLTEQERINLQASRFMICPRCGRALYPES